jgi:LPS sulfotransferase NodH
MRYKRSGSALLVNLLDAHPQAIFVRNEELYGKYQRWDAPEQIFDHIYNKAKRYRNRPFSANGYKYPIEGVGYAENPLVIGHKSSTRRYMPVAHDVKELVKFHEAVGLQLKFLHLVRDPHEQINARWQQKEWRRKNAPLDDIIAHVREQTEANYQMWIHVAEHEYHQIHYEDLVERPLVEMVHVCNFLGLPLLEDHLDNCRKLVRKVEEPVAATWTDQNREAVKQLIADYPEFYERYA